MMPLAEEEDPFQPPDPEAAPSPAERKPYVWGSGRTLAQQLEAMFQALEADPEVQALRRRQARVPGTEPNTRLSGTFRLSSGEMRPLSVVFPGPLTAEDRTRVLEGQYMNIPARLVSAETGEWDFFHFPYDVQVEATFEEATDSRTLNEFLDEMDRPMLLETVAALLMLVGFFGIWYWLLTLGAAAQ